MHFQAIDIDNDHFWPLLHNIEECNATHSRVSVLSMRLAKWAIVGGQHWHWQWQSFRITLQVSLLKRHVHCVLQKDQQTWTLVCFSMLSHFLSENFQLPFRTPVRGWTLYNRMHKVVHDNVQPAPLWQSSIFVGLKTVFSAINNNLWFFVLTEMPFYAWILKICNLSHSHIKLTSRVKW